MNNGENLKSLPSARPILKFTNEHEWAANLYVTGERQEIPDVQVNLHYLGTHVQIKKGGAGYFARRPLFESAGVIRY